MIDRAVVDNFRGGTKVLDLSPIWRILGWISPVLLVFTLARIVLSHEPGFGDVYAYHEAWPDLYDGGVGGAHAYLYSPAFAQLIYPLTLLPFPLFYGLLMAANVGALLFLVGWRWAGWVVVLFYPATLELAVGNIHLLLAAATVIGLRHPAAWALPLLTKVTAGVGLLYLPLRGMAVGLGVTIGIVAVSALLAPQLWVEWATLLASSNGTDPWAFVQVPLVYRLPIALALVGVGRWQRWPWMVPIACLVALPVIWLGSLVYLLAIPRLSRFDTSRNWATRPRSPLPMSRSSSGG
jgi:hypothetical protein